MKAQVQRPAKMQIYRDARGEWRWRLRASNGRIIACSGEGYRGQRSAGRAAQRVRAYFVDGGLRWPIR
jgi:uncharacterized protein YegP (UPF0339 family)